MEGEEVAAMNGPLEFIHVYDAAKSKPRTRSDARCCIAALTNGDVQCDDLLFLRGVKRHLVGEYKGMPSGALLVAILRASSPKAIAALVSLMAPKVWPINEAEDKVRRRTTELYADCFLALDRWFREWSSRQ